MCGIIATVKNRTRINKGPIKRIVKRIYIERVKDYINKVERIKYNVKTILF